MQADQRPKVERYGEVLFVVVRSARYIDATEEVEFNEFHLLVSPGTGHRLPGRTPGRRHGDLRRHGRWGRATR